MKIFEVVEPRVRLLPAYERFINGEKHWSSDAFIPGGQVKCVNCGGAGKLRGHITKCKKCEGSGSITNSNDTPIMIYTLHQFGTIEDLLGITDITKTDVIPRERIPDVMQKIINFNNRDQEHLNRKGSTEVSRRVEIGSDPKIATIKAQRKTIEPVNSKDLIDLVNSFAQFVYAVQQIQGASIVVDEI
jgi:hypothetical protein